VRADQIVTALLSSPAGRGAPPRGPGRLGHPAGSPGHPGMV